MIDGWFAVVQELIAVAAETLKVLLRTLDEWMSCWCGRSLLIQKMPVVPLPTVCTALGFPAHLHSEAMEASHSLAEMYLQSQEHKGDLFCRAFFCLVCDFYFWSCSECSLWVVSILLECNLLFCWVPSAEGKVGNWEIREYNVLYQEAEQPPSLESHTAWENLLLKTWYVKSQCWLLG